jgi:hypothetical protein
MLQRTLAALLATSVRSSGDIFSALANPPFDAPSLDRVFAALVISVLDIPSPPKYSLVCNGEQAYNTKPGKHCQTKRGICVEKYNLPDYILSCIR